ncbi:hypothetical protein J2R96_002219 [Bradyrhizobium elkanii]|nr:hypothetical protein [Bradyrhizobium elkanii]
MFPIVRDFDFDLLELKLWRVKRFHLRPAEQLAPDRK